MSRERIPEITHLQFLVLGMLRAAPQRGRDIRRSLARHGAHRSGPAFYQLMARLEDAGLVSGEYDKKVVAGQIIKERRYTILPAGVAAFRATRNFYSSAIAAFDEADGLAHA